MKRIGAIMLVIGMLMSVANAETAWIGHVVPNKEVCVTAPCGGTVQDLFSLPGELIAADTQIAAITTSKVYSPIAGTITALFAEVGSDGAFTQTQYGGFLWIEPECQYTLACTTSAAFNSSANRYIHIGETVYLRNMTDGKKKGTGLIVALNEREPNAYTVQVLSGTFDLKETISVYRKSDYDKTSLIGRGTVARTLPVAVNTEGTIYRLHVKAGETVQAGTLLAETISVDCIAAELDNSVKVLTDGIVAQIHASNGTSVQQNEVIATIYPVAELMVEVLLPESSLKDIYIGMPVIMSFNWDPDESSRIEGSVHSISYVNEDDEDYPRYAVRIDFPADASTRVGMTATVWFGATLVGEQ